MVVMVGLFSPRKDQELEGEEAVRRAVEEAGRFLDERKLRNVFVDLAHEFDHTARMDQPLFREPGGAEKKAKLTGWFKAAAPGIEVGVCPYEKSETADTYPGMDVRIIQKEMEIPSSGFVVNVESQKQDSYEDDGVFNEGHLVHSMRYQPIAGRWTELKPCRQKGGPVPSMRSAGSKSPPGSHWPSATRPAGDPWRSRIPSRGGGPARPSRSPGPGKPVQVFRHVPEGARWLGLFEAMHPARGSVSRLTCCMVWSRSYRGRPVLPSPGKSAITRTPPPGMQEQQGDAETDDAQRRFWVAHGEDSEDQ